MNGLPKISTTLWFDKEAEAAASHYVKAIAGSAILGIEHYGKAGDAWSGVKLLSQVIATGAKRPAGADVTLFKAMGMGISDLSVAVRVYERALARKIGKEFAKPKRAMPRWRSARRPDAA